MSLALSGEKLSCSNRFRAFAVFSSSLVVMGFLDTGRPNGSVLIYAFAMPIHRPSNSHTKCTHAMAIGILVAYQPDIASWQCVIDLHPHETSLDVFQGASSTLENKKGIWIMKLDSLEKLYVHELKDLYSAEKQLLEALPMMEKSATDKELKAAIADHLKQTKGHVARLEKIFSGLDYEPGGHKCSGMEGLIKEGEHFLEGEVESNVLDAAIVAAAQRIEHYEIAAYGTARAYAEKLGRQKEADYLQETLNEEGLCNQALTRLAERRLNFVAMTQN
jgi:ferritin-like metal-binding protein YciE